MRIQFSPRDRHAIFVTFVLECIYLITESNMRIQWTFLCGSLLLLAACNSNPGWDGHSAKAKPEVLAEEACKCIYEVMDAETEFNMGKVLDGLDDFLKHQATGAEGSISEKWPDIAIAMIKVGELTDKIDGSPCMQAVDDKALGQGVPIEEVFEALDAHCKLSVFYN
jgi:hypothetical protein